LCTTIIKTNQVSSEHKQDINMGEYIQKVV